MGATLQDRPTGPLNEADIASAGDTRYARISFFKGELFGCIMSTAGSSATLTVGAGSAVDSTGARAMNLASSLAKTTAAWAAGAGGGLDTGAIANSTWYHWFLIMNVSTLAVDVVFSATATPANGPTTMPSGYTLFRRIGSMKTNGSAQWTSFLQTGDYFALAAGPVIDINVTNPGTSAVLRTLASVPTGVKVEAAFDATILNASGVANGTTYFSDPDTTDYAPVGNDVLGITNNNAANVAIQMRMMTNTSAQIRSRALASGVGSGLAIAVRGWTDPRGKLQ